MSAVSPDFDVLAERADDYGALWASRTLQRIATESFPPREWPGTIDDARRVVDTFAGRTAFVYRERLAAIVQHVAEGVWMESVRASRGRLRELR
jgi:hypothetical protein